MIDQYFKIFKTFLLPLNFQDFVGLQLLKNLMFKLFNMIENLEI